MSDDLAIMAIVQQIRKEVGNDHPADFQLTLEEAMKLIDDFGRQEYLRGEIKGSNNPRREDMGC